MRILFKKSFIAAAAALLLVTVGLAFFQKPSKVPGDTSLTSTSIPETAIHSIPPPTSIPEKVYFVAATGSDTNPGSMSQPWETINYAVQQLQPGAILYIRGGTYTQVVNIG